MRLTRVRACVCLTQNPEDEAVEAFYRFPLGGSGVSVTDFAIEIDGRRIRSSLVAKDEAADTYDDALAQGNTAALLEELGRAADTRWFQTSIGNLPARGSCVVSLVYSQLASLARGRGLELELVVPETLVPMFASEEATSSERLSISLSLRLSSAIKAVTSPSHSIDVALGTAEAGATSTAVVTLAAGAERLTTLQRALVVRVALSESPPSAWLEKEPASGRASAGMVVAYPQPKRVPLKRPEFVFLLDRSGSMRREQRIDHARNALSLFLRGLPDDCVFNIVSFGTMFSRLWPHSQPYNDETLAYATNAVSSMKADMQETRLFEPLASIFTHAELPPATSGGAHLQRHGGRGDHHHRRRPQSFTLALPPDPAQFRKQIVILTDGAVNSPEKVVELIERHCANGDARVFTVGLGDGVSYYLVRGMVSIALAGCLACSLARCACMKCLLVSTYVARRRRDGRQGSWIGRVRDRQRAPRIQGHAAAEARVLRRLHARQVAIAGSPRQGDPTPGSPRTASVRGRAALGAVRARRRRAAGVFAAPRVVGRLRVHARGVQDRSTVPARDQQRATLDPPCVCATTNRRARGRDAPDQSRPRTRAIAAGAAAVHH